MSSDIENLRQLLRKYKKLVGKKLKTQEIGKKNLLSSCKQDDNMIVLSYEYNIKNTFIRMEGQKFSFDNRA